MIIKTSIEIFQFTSKINLCNNIYSKALDFLYLFINFIGKPVYMLLKILMNIKY